jgi:hypothetical protein
MLEDQGGQCPICGTSEPKGKGWVVDHDHSCCATWNTCGNCVRGIICANCNSMLGFGRDSADVLQAAANYLYERTIPA